ncbi:MAG TPA: KamA family radical SAM protein [Spirochaetia bacterium]|nr:KamA family radical SAM protein [Spirochaetia bacterium]
METRVLSTEEAEPPGTMPVVQELAGLAGIRTTIPPFKPYQRTFKRAAPSTPKFPVSRRSEELRARYFPYATVADWCDWRWQMRNRIRTLETLEKIIRLSEEERMAITRRTGSLPFAITPYYLGLIDPDDPNQPLRRTMIPVMDEYIHTPGEAEDPLGEDRDSPVPCIVHRYPDRVLFLVSNTCASNCRYCTRSRIVENPDTNSIFFQAQWEQAIAYITEHQEVRDVLLSGGDPLTLSDEKLEWLLSRLRRIPHVEFLRIGTKAPVVMPLRITSALTRMLKRFHPLWMSIHFTHPDELTEETREACARLADAGIPLGSQTVLLAGINDSVEVMKRLMHGLLMARVKPYYLYQCDPIIGSSHFRTPVRKGLEIIKGLRGHTSGYAVPSYVIDAPQGGGKIPLLPDYTVGWDGDDLVLKNYQDLYFRYPDTRETCQ